MQFHWQADPNLPVTSTAGPGRFIRVQPGAAGPPGWTVGSCPSDRRRLRVPAPAGPRPGLLGSAPATEISSSCVQVGFCRARFPRDRRAGLGYCRRSARGCHGIMIAGPHGPARGPPGRVRSPSPRARVWHTVSPARIVQVTLPARQVAAPRFRAGGVPESRSQKAGPSSSAVRAFPFVAPATLAYNFDARSNSYELEDNQE